MFWCTCPLVRGFTWMTDQKGLVSGFVAAGFRSGATVFNVLATWLFNSENASPNPKTGFFSEVGRRCCIVHCSSTLVNLKSADYCPPRYVLPHLPRLVVYCIPIVDSAGDRQTCTEDVHDMGHERPSAGNCGLYVAVTAPTG